MSGNLSHLRQRIELPLDLQSADVGEGLWLQPRSVQDVVAVDQKAVELANHLERAAKGNMRQCVKLCFKLLYPPWHAFQVLLNDPVTKEALGDCHGPHECLQE